MSDETYNGWTNWDTWNAKLWLDNEETTQRDAMMCALAPRDRGIEALKFLVLHSTKAVTGDGIDMRRVNWDEIYDAYAEDQEDA